MKPIGKYLIVKDIREEVITASGLMLSNEEIDNMRYCRASVVAAGTEVNDITAGEILYYEKSRSFTMMVKGELVTVIREMDVVVVE